jgi:hypothetical protein
MPGEIAEMLSGEEVNLDEGPFEIPPPTFNPVAARDVSWTTTTDNSTTGGTDSA